MSGVTNLGTANDLARRRAGGSHVSMFTRMLVRAAALRRGRAASALLAMVVAAAVATAMMNLYVDVQAKLRNEFRNYGANVVVVAKDGQALPSDALAKVESSLGTSTLAVPFSYIVARTDQDQPVVVVGTDFARVRQLNRWWNVSHWPTNSAEALVGMKADSALGFDRQPFELSFQGHKIQLVASGLLQTGADEDSRIFVDQATLTTWTGVSPSTMEVAVNGSAEDIDRAMKALVAALPSAEVRPIRQITEGEANVLGKARKTLYASALLIVLTASLCVLATLIGWVFDRRRDFAIMKALGASEALVNAFFAAEAAVLGIAGAVIGFVLGIGLAAWIGRANFHAPVVPRFSVFPYVLAGSVAVALISAVVPIGLLRRVQPAIILRGE
jgi:putative ABC transport system permease protein